MLIGKHMHYEEPTYLRPKYISIELEGVQRELSAHAQVPTCKCKSIE